MRPADPAGNVERRWQIPATLRCRVDRPRQPILTRPQTAPYRRRRAGPFMARKTVSRPRPKPIGEGTMTVALREIDRIIARLDAGIAEERKEMGALLSRLRTTRIFA
jgi:hypothetical protein